MTKRFATRFAVSLTLSVLAYATAASADTIYQPYYYAQNRDTYQFATISPPLDNGVTVPTPPSAPATNWKAPEEVFHQQAAAMATPMLPLGTRSGLDGGIQGSYYSDKENGADIRTQGPQLGVTLDATVVSNGGIFDTVDFREAYGRVDYNSPDGNSKDHANEMMEVRDVIGKDFVWNNQYSLSPYIGIGYRNLYNDNRGITSLGDSGYQTLSQYLYIPIGVKPEMRINGSDLVTMDLEYDYFAHGWQTSHLSDAVSTDPTVRNSQSTGLGFRGNLMWNTGNWAFGPFVNYWSVNNSASQTFFSPSASCGHTTCTNIDPHSITFEGGLQLKYHFFGF